MRKLHACRSPQRVCPYGLSFVDTPLGDLNHDGELKAATSVLTQASNANLKELWQGTEAQEAHFYAECSNKGFCDRALGECACFDGYTGSACQRTTCPNDCSGHGQCYTLREIAAGPNVEKTHEGSAVGRNFRIEDYQYGTYMTSGVSEAFDYNLWDADKNQACVCDAGYFGPDCAMRDCPRGNDPLTNDPKHCGGEECTSEVQHAYIGVPDTTTLATAGKDTDFYLEWSDSEEYSGLLSTLRSETFTLKVGLTGDDYAELLQDAIESFPNGVLNGVTVTCEGMGVNVGGTTPTALPAHEECTTPLALHATDDAAIMFKIDFTNGPQGDVSGFQPVMVSIGDSKDDVDRAEAIGLTFADADPSTKSLTDPSALLGVTYSGGSYQIASTIYTASSGAAAGTNANGNQENSPCSNRGLCDYTTGLCQCFAGYTREDCSVQSALAM